MRFAAVRWALACTTAWLVVCMCVVGACGNTHAENAATATTYEAEQLACVDRATTRSEADACRCAVKARYGRPCDGGTP